MANEYATLEELQNRIDPDIDWTTDQETQLELCLEAASRAIDGYTGQFFYETATSRVYFPHLANEISISPAGSVTTVKIDSDGDGVFETTLASSDYRLFPINGPVYDRIVLTPWGKYLYFPTYGVEVTANYGYSTVPVDVKLACLMLAHRLWLRKDAMFGVVGSPQVGLVTVQAEIRKDADIQALLDPYIERVLLW